MTHQIDLKEVSEREVCQQLAASAKDGKTLNATFKGDGRAEYVVEHHGSDVRLLYKGHSLENALSCYNTCEVFGAEPKRRAIPLSEVIAKAEAIPERKAALDRARVRRALSSLYFASLSAMSDEEAVAELCKTPGGKAQYDKISKRAPGDPYTAVRPDNSVSVDELVVGMFNTPEGRAEFEEAGREIRAALGLEGGVEDLPKTLARAALSLLKKARDSLADGFESADALEAKWSREDKALVARIDEVLDNHLAKDLLKTI